MSEPVDLRDAIEQVSVEKWSEMIGHIAATFANARRDSCGNLIVPADDLWHLSYLMEWTVLLNQLDVLRDMIVTLDREAT